MAGECHSLFLENWGASLERGLAVVNMQSVAVGAIKITHLTARHLWQVRHIYNLLPELSGCVPEPRLASRATYAYAN